MTSNVWIQIGVYVLVLLMVTKPMGIFIAHVMQGGNGGYMRPLRPIEHGLYRLFGVDADEEMGWKQYAIALLLFKCYVKTNFNFYR